MHLPAAGLLEGELDLVPEALEHLDGRPARLREERVVEAGYEQRYAHGRPRVRGQYVGLARLSIPHLPPDRSAHNTPFWTLATRRNTAPPGTGVGPLPGSMGLSYVLRPRSQGRRDPERRARHDPLPHHGMGVQPSGEAARERLVTEVSLGPVLILHRSEESVWAVFGLGLVRHLGPETSEQHEGVHEVR